MFLNRFLFFLALFLGEAAAGAACCGGGSAVPSLISTDDKAQLGAVVSYGQVVAETASGGHIRYRSSSDSEVMQTIRIEAAHLISDRWQIGLGLPLIRRARTRGLGTSASTGMGDATATVAFEALPEWDYSVWRPKGLVYLQLTAPTGRPAFDSQSLYRVDARGRGFWTVTLGALLTKAWGPVDVFFVGQGHTALPRTAVTDGGELVIRPGWGSSGVLGAGLSPGMGRLRLGAALALSFEEAVWTTGVLTARAEPVSLAALSLQLSYSVAEDLFASVTATDQTLLGVSSNSPLQRSVAFLVQRRWGR